MTELQNEAKEIEKRHSEVTKEQKIQLQKMFQTLEEQKSEIGKCSICCCFDILTKKIAIIDFI